uniref:Uncharacterized protein n=1 Tax=Arundo donax TaxID=35708 RepID=A0A0A9AJL9_ARUDO
MSQGLEALFLLEEFSWQFFKLFCLPLNFAPLLLLFR